MRFRRDTASISDSADRFARQVAPLYVANDWLRLGDATEVEAITKIRDMTIDLYLGVLDDIKEGHVHNGFAFHATGRVKVIYWQWEQDEDEIEFCLTLEHEMQDDYGQWRNGHYWDEDE